MSRARLYQLFPWCCLDWLCAADDMMANAAPAHWAHRLIAASPGISTRRRELHHVFTTTLPWDWQPKWTRTMHAITCTSSQTGHEETAISCLNFYLAAGAPAATLGRLHLMSVSCTLSSGNLNTLDLGWSWADHSKGKGRSPCFRPDGSRQSWFWEQTCLTTFCIQLLELVVNRFQISF